MKNVLLLVHDDAGQEARLQGALDLTRSLSGHLHCVDVTPWPLVADTVWGAAAGTVLYDESEREERNLVRLRERLAGEDVPWTCQALRGDFTSCLMGAVRTADLVVLNRALAGLPKPDMRALAGNLFAQGDMLVLAVAEDCRGFDAGAPALVAWDGSQAAMRTLRRAVPLLALAGSVTLFQAGELPEGAIAADEAATYLARHGIKSEVEIAARGAAPAAQIAAAAGRLGAGYCVMGAYGHNRLREAVFGGVTREMLGSAGLPLLLGH